MSEDDRNKWRCPRCGYIQIRVTVLDIVAGTMAPDTSDKRAVCPIDGATYVRLSQDEWEELLRH